MNDGVRRLTPSGDDRTEASRCKRLLPGFLAETAVSEPQLANGGVGRVIPGHLGLKQLGRCHGIDFGVV